MTVFFLWREELLEDLFAEYESSFLDYALWPIQILAGLLWPITAVIASILYLCWEL